MTRRDALGEVGITDRIMHRRHADQRSPSRHKGMNIAITPRRGEIEKLFGTVKRRYLYRRVRYRNLERNRWQLWLPCSAMNPHRADQLTGRATAKKPDGSQTGLLHPGRSSSRHPTCWTF